MKKLELKHLAPYLPYGLKGLDEYGMYNDLGELLEFELKGINEHLSVPIWYTGDKSYISSRHGRCKPILHPLSDLTKEIEHNEERFVPLFKINKMLPDDVNIDAVLDFEVSTDSYGTARYISWIMIYEPMQKFFEWHFDCFGLIEAGLAMDINSLKEKV